MKPLFSLIVHVEKPNSCFLKQCIESVRQQINLSWELCVVYSDDAPPQEVLSVLDYYCGIDVRIIMLPVSARYSISASLNFGVQIAQGTFVAFLHSEDTLELNALNELYLGISVSGESRVDILYTDDDRIDEEGHCSKPHFKPCWSPDYLLSTMYIGSFFVVRKELFLSVGGFRERFDTIRGYDFLLRASQKAHHISHIPKVLYHQRLNKHETSSSVDHSIDGIINARVEAVKEYLEIVGRKGVVEKSSLMEGHLHVRYKILDPPPPVTLMILTGDAINDVTKKPFVHQALKSISKHTLYTNFNIVVIHNNDISIDTKKLIEELGGQHYSANDKGKFNYSRRVNFGFSKLETDLFLVLNDDIEVSSSGWLRSLVEWFQDPEVGIVGTRLLYPDSTVQHSSIALIPQYGATHPFYKMHSKKLGYQGYTHTIRNCSAVTGAVMASRISLVEKIGGFDEFLSTDFNDIDFCLKAISEGYKIIYTPYTNIVHHEGSTLKRDRQNQHEVDLFVCRWDKKLIRDSYINTYSIKEHYPELIDPCNSIPS